MVLLFQKMAELEKPGYNRINLGQRVSYEIDTNKKSKHQAINIKIIR